MSLVRFFARHRDAVSRIAGAVLVAVGAIDLANNVPFILLTLERAAGSRHRSCGPLSPDLESMWRYS